MSTDALPSLDRTTLRERALVALRSAIFSGQYAPGDHLGEVEIAARLSISRGTVREALRHLEQEGLVTAGMRGMLRVRTLSADEVHELYRVRGALETLAVSELIASSRRQEAVTALDVALVRLDAATGLIEQIDLDLGFHALLCELSGNTILLRSWRHLEGPTRVVVMSAAAGQDREVTLSADHHRPIVRAIEQGDAETARAVIDGHMREAAERLAAQL